MTSYQDFRPDQINLSKYIFYTGKGGVGKTSTACATAAYLADHGKKVFLVSTDPASNLQDVFGMELDDKGVSIDQVPNLTVANLDPEQAAADYRESVIAPYRGKLPDSIVAIMEEQRSGSCTVEIAAFNEFAYFLTDPDMNETYDHIIFDTAPTGHTLRLLALPSAWDNFIETSKYGASCLGQLSGLADQKEMYDAAVKTLESSDLTTLILVTRPEMGPLMEASRASGELSSLGIRRQILVVNGVLEKGISEDDTVSGAFLRRQEETLSQIPDTFSETEVYTIPLRSYNVCGIENIRRMLFADEKAESAEKDPKMTETFPSEEALVDDLVKNHKKIIFTMGKGGVGKTSVAIHIAKSLAKRGIPVHLTTTDPAGHMTKADIEGYDIELSNIDEKEELAKYQQFVIDKAIRNGVIGGDLDYIKEDLRSPCTQEIAIFRAFAEIVERSKNRVVVIDTAPTGHTLLLLSSTENYAREMKHASEEVPESVKNLLPRLKDRSQTEVVIVTLPEATPYFEAKRLNEDLNRAEISCKWWVVNASLLAADTTNPFLRKRADAEHEWIEKIREISDDNIVVIPWRGNLVVSS